MVTLDRTIFETSRATEYFDARELQAQTGQPVEMFATVALKELLDNALDACETAGVPPVVDIATSNGGDLIHIAVQDNAEGIAPEVVERILNFQTRTSDKSVYRAPTRGAQGNALKTILGMPCALGCGRPVSIEAREVHHTISARIDPAGELQVDHDTEDISITGTKIGLALPIVEDQVFEPGFWAQGFSLFNPHALVRISDFGNGIKLAKPDDRKTSNSYQPTVSFPGQWPKFLPTDLTSPWWYNAADLKRLVFSHIAEARRNGKSLSLREFVRRFRGLSGSAKAKAVCAQFYEIGRLNDFESEPERVEDLLQAMRQDTKSPSPGILGFVGEDHFRARFDEWYGVKRFWYRKIAKEIDDIPFVFEAAVAETQERGDVFTGINFSPTFEDPLANTGLSGPKFYTYGIYGFLNQGHAALLPEWLYARNKAKTAVATHLVCPALQFMDRGKTRLKISEAMAKEIAKVLWYVVKNLYHEEERRRKDAARAERRECEHERGSRYTLKDVVFHVLPEALSKATGDGQYPVSARTLYYQVRPLVQPYTTKDLDYTYFSQTLLTEYRELYGSIEGLYYDPRGILYEPHTGETVPLGTREVQSYTFPIWLYNKILYVEKKGLWPILEAAKLAERYDMAVIAAEGYATEAARVFFQQADKDQKYELYALHDADPHGYNIARTLCEETRRMPGYSVHVIDLGLHLEEALEMGLETETFTRKNALPEGLELTEVEWEYFGGPQEQTRRSCICQRVELNALSAPALINYIERKLIETGAIGKVIPPDEKLFELADEIYRDQVNGCVENTLDRLLSVDKIKRSIADQFNTRFPLERSSKWIKQAFDEDDTLSWRKALEGKLELLLHEQRSDLEEALEIQIHKG